MPTKFHAHLRQCDRCGGARPYLCTEGRSILHSTMRALGFRQTGPDAWSKGRQHSNDELGTCSDAFDFMMTLAEPENKKKMKRLYAILETPIVAPVERDGEDENGYIILRRSRPDPREIAFRQRLQEEGESLLVELGLPTHYEIPTGDWKPKEREELVMPLCEWHAKELDEEE